MLLRLFKPHMVKSISKSWGGGTRQYLFGGIGQVRSIRQFCELFVGNLPVDATEESVREHFSQCGLVLSAKIIRNPNTMESVRHGYVAFADRETLEKALMSQPHLISNQPIIIRPLQEIKFVVTELSPSSTEQSLKAYFSRFGSVIRCHLNLDPTKGINAFIHFSDQNEMNKDLASNVHVIDGKLVQVERIFPKELTLYVGNLSPTTTDHSLYAFYSQFGSLLRAEVKRNELTGQSRCFGYICFSSRRELDNAMHSVPHIIDGTKVTAERIIGEFTLFVAALPSNMSEDRLRKYFEQFGPVYICKIARDKQTKECQGFGWVTFSSQRRLKDALAARPHIIDGIKIDAQSCNVRRSDDTTLFVGGLSPKTTDEMLYDVFSKFGHLVWCAVKFDRDGQSRRFGYVTYSSPNGVPKAMYEGPHVIDGRVLRVEPKDQCETPKSAASSSYGSNESY